MTRKQKDKGEQVVYRHFPLTIAASTYDSTLCGWKYMVSTSQFNSTAQHHELLRAHMESKMAEGETYVGYVEDGRSSEQHMDEDGDDNADNAAAGDDDAGTGTDDGNDDPEQVIQFLKAVEQEQKRIIAEKKEMGLPVDDDKTEEFFDFLTAAKREQLRMLQSAGASNDGDDNSNAMMDEDFGFDDEDDDDDGGDDSFGMEDYEELDTLAEEEERRRMQESAKRSSGHQNTDGATSSTGKGKRKRAVKPLFQVDEKSGLLLPPEKTDTLYPLFSYTPHNGVINALDSFGIYLVSGGNDETCVVYNMANRKEQFVLSKLEGSITTVRFLRNGRHILMGTDKGTIDLHDFSVNMYCLWSAKAHKRNVTDIAVHPSNKLFLSTGLDSTLKMWDLVSGTLACSIKLKMSATAVSWSPTGTNFALVMNDTVQIYNTESVEKLFDLTHERRVTCVAYLSDGLIATAGENKAITIFDLENEGECLHRLEVHESRIKSIAVEKINVDEYILVTVCSMGGIAVWRVGYNFALLECYERTGARFIGVRINGHPKMRNFVEGREFFMQKQESMQLVQGDEEKEEDEQKMADDHESNNNNSNKKSRSRNKRRKSRSSITSNKSN